MSFVKSLSAMFMSDARGPAVKTAMPRLASACNTAPPAVSVILLFCDVGFLLILPPSRGGIAHVLAGRLPLSPVLRAESVSGVDRKWSESSLNAWSCVFARCCLT